MEQVKVTTSHLLPRVPTIGGIDRYAFSERSNQRSVPIPSKVSKIGNGAFNKCMKSPIIRSSITAIPPAMTRRIQRRVRNADTNALRTRLSSSTTNNHVTFECHG
ncbi:MAG: leucine-rich repeat protein [Muribaculaceae bacterium]|nr:leucine-rich repeat protein [Muribaculaceae bacterium]